MVRMICFIDVQVTNNLYHYLSEQGLILDRYYVTSGESPSPYFDRVSYVHVLNWLYLNSKWYRMKQDTIKLFILMHIRILVTKYCVRYDNFIIHACTQIYDVTFKRRIKGE